jgi:rhodanese-related sulfurtransferase
MKTFEDICADAKTRITEVSPAAVAARLHREDKDWVLIDVREHDEFRAGHLPGALGIGRGVLEYHIRDEVPDPDADIVLYCRGGNRSALAADSLRNMGYTQVKSMSGGYREWTQDANRPVSHEGEPIKH